VTIFPAFLDHVEVYKADVPFLLNDAKAKGVLWQAAPGRFLLDTPNVGRYLVEEGRRVKFALAAGASFNAVKRFARLSPMAALLYQRGIPALHAAGAANAQGAILLAGNSGAGKSVLLTMLLQRKWAMLSDDLSVVSIADGCKVVQPTFPDIALWPEDLKKLGYDANGLTVCDANRRFLSLPDQFAIAPQPLRAIFWLNVHNREEISLENLSGAARFQTAGALLYNSHIADALIDRVDYMRNVAAIFQNIPIVRLNRPRNQWRAEEIANIIENELK